MIGLVVMFEPESSTYHPDKFTMADLSPSLIVPLQPAVAPVSLSVVPEPVVHQQIVSNVSSIPRKRRRTDGDAAGGRAKLTLKDKFDILSYWDQFPEHQNYAAIGRKYDVSRQSIRKVIQNRELILQDYHSGVPHDARRSRVLPPDMAVLDEKVLEFINSMPTSTNNLKRNVLPISMDTLKAKATEIAAHLNIKINKGRCTEAPWVAGNAWYARFCNRHNFIREPLPVDPALLTLPLPPPPHQNSVLETLPSPNVHNVQHQSRQQQQQDDKPDSAAMIFAGLAKDDDSSIDSRD